MSTKEEKTKQTSIERINEALGVANIDDLLDSISIENEESVNKITDTISAEVITTLTEINNDVIAYNNGNTNAVASIEDNLNEVSDLININKLLIRRIYENVESSELIDSELTNSAATLIKSCMDSIKVFIDLYREKKAFYNKIALEMLTQKHRLEMLQRRHDYRMIETGMSKKEEADVETSIEYSQESIVKALQELERSNLL